MFIDFFLSLFCFAQESLLVVLLGPTVVLGIELGSAAYKAPLYQELYFSNLLLFF